MRKTMLSVLVIGASVFTASAFAQAHLGGAAQVGASAHVGAAAPSALHAVDQTTAQTERRLQRTDSRLKRHTRKAVDTSRSSTDDHADADADANANGTIGAGADDSHADANANVEAGAGLDTAATAGKAGEMGQGVGGDVRDAAHTAIQSTDRAAGSVGDAVKGVNASGNAGVSGNANTHGH
ncbi:hypothetical protein [Rhodanobacter denitrificans]|uniref:Phage infection protein n=1 Tax=Rhodanobacter denitrificans TaxID=666685 RepID=M4NAL5_9GAMM|nr:hypothetical protein [Rhodanobacter denitrificans]AGG87524.1 hypothetical protein R2APBS1_0348 [Rhodanobacter denitrificans]